MRNYSVDMPDYVYEHQIEIDCSKGKTFEIWGSITKDALTQCPECASPIKRLIVPGSGFILAGGGWYSSGYDSKSNTPPKVDSKPVSKPVDKNSNPATSKESKTYKKDK